MLYSSSIALQQILHNSSISICCYYRLAFWSCVDFNPVLFLWLSATSKPSTATTSTPTATTAAIPRNKLGAGCKRNSVPSMVGMLRGWTGMISSHAMEFCGINCQSQLQTLLYLVIMMSTLSHINERCGITDFLIIKLIHLIVCHGFFDKSDSRISCLVI